VRVVPSGCWPFVVDAAYEPSCCSFHFFFFSAVPELFSAITLIGVTPSTFA